MVSTLLLFPTQSRRQVHQHLYESLLDRGFVDGCDQADIDTNSRNLWRLMSLLRSGGLHVVTRVTGILLAALALQFVLNRIGEFVRLLEAGRG
jgi:MarC family integral membrane protein